jgi:hypothetical protein
MRIHNIRKNEADWHTKKICEFCESIIKICGFAIIWPGTPEKFANFQFADTDTDNVACAPAVIACIPAVADVPANPGVPADNGVTADPGFSSEVVTLGPLNLFANKKKPEMLPNMMCSFKCCGSGAFLTLYPGWENNPEIPESFPRETVFWVKFFDANPVSSLPWIRDGKIRIRDTVL